MASAEMDHEPEHEHAPTRATRSSTHRSRRGAGSRWRRSGSTRTRCCACAPNEVDRFDENLARLAERMTELMHDARGVGLAATQVGVLQRLFVFQPSDEEQATPSSTRSSSSGRATTEIADEGCLSLAGRARPGRALAAVTLAGLDLEGKPLRLELEELPARVVQHELDHLDGVLIIERTDPESRREALATLRHRPSL